MNAPFSPPIETIGQNMAEIVRYWSDAAFKAQCDQQRAEKQAHANEAHDRAQIAKGTRWPSHWTEEEKSEASQRLLDAYREDMAEDDRRLKAGDYRRIYR